MDPVMLLLVAMFLGFSILFLQYFFKTSAVKKREDIDDHDGELEGDNRHDNTLVVGGGRRVRRNARIRDEASDNEDNDETQTGVSVGKIGTKKLRKLQAKADRKAMREQEEALREDERKRKELREKERKEEEETYAIQQKKNEEKERRLKEEQEQKELEEYLKLKESFVVEDEGHTEDANEEKSLQEFIQYLKTNKVVFLEDLAAEFNMRTQNCIERVQSLQSTGQLTGVVDDRGKFIYVSLEELHNVAKFIKQRGRVSIAELAQSSNSLISLQ